MTNGTGNDDVEEWADAASWLSMRRRAEDRPDFRQRTLPREPAACLVDGVAGGGHRVGRFGISDGPGVGAGPPADGRAERGSAGPGPIAAARPHDLDGFDRGVVAGRRHAAARPVALVDVPQRGPVVKAVMVGLAFASLVTWTIGLAKALELFAARSRASRALGGSRKRTISATLSAASSPPAAPVPSERSVAAAVRRGDALRAICRPRASRSASPLRLARIEAGAGRAWRAAPALLATIGATAPFVGLFGTVWGIMNASSASPSADHQPRGRRARHRRGAARHRARPRRRHPGRHHLQHVRPRHRRLSGAARPTPRPSRCSFSRATSTGRRLAAAAATACAAAAE